MLKKFSKIKSGLTMKGRTFLRIMLDNLFVNNAFCKVVNALVNFCNEQSYYNRKELKFLKKMPLNNIEESSSYQKRFLFNNVYKSGVNQK